MSATKKRVCKAAVLAETYDGSTPLLNDKHEQMLQMMVHKHMNAGTAYALAYDKPKMDRFVASVNASKLLTMSSSPSQCMVKTRWDWLRQETAKQFVREQVDLVRYLWGVVTTPVGEIDKGHPLAQEFSEMTIGRGKGARTVTKVKSIGKLEAATLMCRILGWEKGIVLDHNHNVNPQVRQAMETIFGKAPKK